MARQSPLLMHALLATAALHLAVLYPEDSSSPTYRTRGLYHHGLGLGLFNIKVARLPENSPNSPVLFTFGVFLIIWAYASPRITTTTTTTITITTTTTTTTTATSDTSDLDALLSSLELVRGNRILCELQSDWIQSHPINRFTQPKPRSHTPASTRRLPPSLAAALTELRKQGTDYVDNIAIDHLERFLLDTFSPAASASSDSDVDMRLPLGWPALVGNAFWERLKRHLPTALLILMHYAIILRYYELKVWWMEGWSEKLLVATEAALANVEGAKDRYDWGLMSGCVWGEVSKMKSGLCSTN